eukprot:49226-Alexandrium_andersonii.AAC.1
MQAQARAADLGTCAGQLPTPPRPKQPATSPDKRPPSTGKGRSGGVGRPTDTTGLGWKRFRKREQRTIPSSRFQIARARGRR